MNSDGRWILSDRFQPHNSALCLHQSDFKQVTSLTSWLFVVRHDLEYFDYDISIYRIQIFVKLDAPFSSWTLILPVLLSIQSGCTGRWSTAPIILVSNLHHSFGTWVFNYSRSIVLSHSMHRHSSCLLGLTVTPAQFCIDCEYFPLWFYTVHVQSYQFWCPIYGPGRDCSFIAPPIFWGSQLKNI